MFKAIIFDMDGLMFDSEAVGIKMIEKVLEDYPFEFSRELILSIIGTNQKNVRNVLMDHYGENFPFDEIMSQEKELVLKYYDEEDIPKKPGLIELLEFLKEINIRIGLATSTYRVRAEHILKKAGVYPYFDVIVCGDEVTDSKPNPEIYQKAVKKLGVTKQDALVLEDSENGLRAAHAAGIRTVFIKDLVTPKDEVLNEVSHQAKTLHEVIDIVKQINKLAE